MKKVLKGIKILFAILAVFIGFSLISCSSPVTASVVVPDKTLTGNLTINIKDGEDPYVGCTLEAVYSGGEAVSLQWHRNDIALGKYGNTLLIEEDGVYTASVSAPGYTSKFSNEIQIGELVPVAFTNLQANGSINVTTTQLTLTFDQGIDLTAADISISHSVSGQTVSKGTLSLPLFIHGGGVAYTLPISGFTSGGTITVTVTKSGYTITPSMTATIYYLVPVTFVSVTANGSATANTTYIDLTLTQRITGLSVDDITLSVAGIAKVSLESRFVLVGADPVYRLTVSNVVTNGSINVTVAKAGYLISSATRPVTVYGTGNGTTANPFRVYNYELLLKVGTGTDGWNLSSNYIQTSNIELSYYNYWSPIGPTSTNSFTGTYDGGNFEITDMRIIGSFNHQGMFGYLNGLVKNLNLYVSHIGNNYVGGVAGLVVNGRIENCRVRGNVNGSINGGIAGGIDGTGTITNCTVTADVMTGSFGGGITGLITANGTVENCHYSGNFMGANISSAGGGIVGYNWGTVRNCYTTGTVGICFDGTGGIAGINEGTVNNCYVTGYVGGVSNTGGIIGSNYGSMYSCVALNSQIVRTSGTSLLIGKITNNK